jgi:hypothetical protein
MRDFAQLGVPLSRRAAPDREHTLHTIVEQAFAQHTLPDHTGGAEQDDFHRLIRRMLPGDGIAARRR